MAIRGHCQTCIAMQPRCRDTQASPLPAKLLACCSSSGTGRPALRRHWPPPPPWSCCGQLCVLLLQLGLLPLSSVLLLNHDCLGHCTMVKQCPAAAPHCKLEVALSCFCSMFGFKPAQTSRCSTACSDRCCRDGAARPQGPKDAKETFRSKVMRPLKDFGFGKHSFMEGGVGLFIFAGIGTQPGRVRESQALLASRGCGFVPWLWPLTRQADVACLHRGLPCASCCDVLERCCASRPGGGWGYADAEPRHSRLIAIPRLLQLWALH